MLIIQTYHKVPDVYIRFIPDLLYKMYCTSETDSPRWETMRERKCIIIGAYNPHNHAIIGDFLRRHHLTIRRVGEELLSSLKLCYKL
jgi:hypothetical protein